MQAQPSPTEPSTFRTQVIPMGQAVGILLPAGLNLVPGTAVEVRILPLVEPVKAWPAGYGDVEPIGPDFVAPHREHGRLD